MADDRIITDDERGDDDDVTPSGIARRLGRVLKIVQRANARLDRITAGMQPPPEPDKPPIRDALASIKTEATTLIGKVDALTTRL